MLPGQSNEWEGWRASTASYADELWMGKGPKRIPAPCSRHQELSERRAPSRHPRPYPENWAAGPLRSSLFQNLAPISFRRMFRCWNKIKKRRVRHERTLDKFWVGDGR